MSAESWTFATATEDRVVDLARCFGLYLSPPLIIYLRGELGAGKTTFARALIHSMGHTGSVKSPSYGLLESYLVANLNVLHLDLYRVEDPAELDYLALRDLFDNKSILLVEWPQKGKGFLPPADLELRLDEAEEQRVTVIEAYSKKGRKLLHNVQAELKRQFLD